jgi:hypothetical protein
MSSTPLPLIALLVVSFAVAACGDEDSSASEQDEPLIDVGDPADYAPAVDPDDFVRGIDNPFLPFGPGARWSYESVTDEGIEHIEVVVTNDPKIVMGIDATVVRDTVSLDGRVIEDTWDWYAQDRAGNVWYLGEDTREYEQDGSVSTEGSWEAGVDGALPGIIMHADPQIGRSYRQELYEGEAEDVAEVVRTGESVDVQAGRFRDVLVIREWNPLEPDVVEEKLYARGVGPVLEQQVRGGDQRVELVAHSQARRATPWSADPRSPAPIR